LSDSWLLRATAGRTGGLSLSHRLLRKRRQPGITVAIFAFVYLFELDT